MGGCVGKGGLPAAPSSSHPAACGRPGSPRARLILLLSVRPRLRGSVSPQRRDGRSPLNKHSRGLFLCEHTTSKNSSSLFPRTTPALPSLLSLNPLFSSCYRFSSVNETFSLLGIDSFPLINLDLSNNSRRRLSSETCHAVQLNETGPSISLRDKNVQTQSVS